MPDFEEGLDLETQPHKRRTRGPNKPKPPVVEGGHRRSTSRSKVALALVQAHLAGVYTQMSELEKAVAELKASLQ